MKAVQIQGIQNPIEEVSSKIQQYFRNHGFKQECTFDKDGVEDGGFGFEIRGAIDDLQVQLCYCDYKPRKMVVRDILALDQRISNVECYRCLSGENYRRELGEIDVCTPIYVQIDGQLMETTIYDFVLYGARNKDFSRR